MNSVASGEFVSDYSVIILITLSFQVGTIREAYCDSLFPSVGRSGTEGGILTLSLG